MSGPSGLSVDEVKERLYISACFGDPANSVRPDEPWVRGGTERLYFDHPRSKQVMGSIEVDTTVEKVQQVRVEVFAPPKFAGLVVAFVQSAQVEGEQSEDPVAACPEETPLPPTRDPGPADLAEMQAEEQEGDGLPAEVLAVMPEEVRL